MSDVAASGADGAQAARAARAARLAIGFLLASAGAAVALAVTWAADGPIQLQGVLLGASFLLFGAGLGTWANRLTGPPEETEIVEARPSLAPGPGHELEPEEVEPAADVSRRGLVRASLIAGGALGAAALLPIRALGPNPGRKLLRTAWRSGRQVVTTNGEPVAANEIPLDGLVTAFPQGATDEADGQIVVIRVRPELLDLPEGRATWAPDGLVAYSKVCTHAGCPVGLYSSEAKELLCPCHQSTFDVLRGAEPRGGPAVWPLPQLPLEIGSDGILRAAGPLSAPVGAGWWRPGK